MSMELNFVIKFRSLLLRGSRKLSWWMFGRQAATLFRWHSGETQQIKSIMEVCNEMKLFFLAIDVFPRVGGWPPDFTIIEEFTRRGWLQKAFFLNEITFWFIPVIVVCFWFESLLEEVIFYHKGSAQLTRKAIILQSAMEHAKVAQKSRNIESKANSEVELKRNL